MLDAVATPAEIADAAVDDQGPGDPIEVMDAQPLTGGIQEGGEDEIALGGAGEGRGMGGRHIADYGLRIADRLEGAEVIRGRLAEGEAVFEVEEDDGWVRDGREIDLGGIEVGTLDSDREEAADTAEGVDEDDGGVRREGKAGDVAEIMESHGGIGGGMSGLAGCGRLWGGEGGGGSGGWMRPRLTGWNAGWIGWRIIWAALSGRRMRGGKQRSGAG